MGFPRIIEVNIRTKAQPKIGDVAIKKSKRYGTFGLSYCTPLLFSSLKILSSFMVVPVIRQRNVWLNSCITAPGKRNDFDDLYSLDTSTTAFQCRSL